MNRFSAFDRKSLIDGMQSEYFDILVVGGGITGAGIALDAAARGLKVCLVEMQDFAGGTSSRSTRLIHGGLRYLKQLDFKLVAEVAQERKIIYRNAPHLVKPELLLLPITANGSFGRLGTRAGMWLYELLAGVKREERHRYLDAKETLKAEPLLRQEGLLGGVLYCEYRTDDARLTLSVVREAVNRGALAVSYMKVTDFFYENEKIQGAMVNDRLGSESYRIRAAHVINACGPWVDDLDRIDNVRHESRLRLTKGVHLVFDHSALPLKQAVYFDTFDGRMVFALPHRGKTYVGTTDTFYDGEKEEPRVTPEDEVYLLRCVNAYFQGPGLHASDIESRWAGIRPLIKNAGKRPSEISRRDEIFVSASGLVTIAGGKLTGYRKMAERVVDMVAKEMIATGRRKVPACGTRSVRLSPVAASHLGTGKPNTIKNEKAGRIVERYGPDAEQIFLILAKLEDEEKSHSTNDVLPPMLRAELQYSMEREMCLTPCDFFVRRTGIAYFEIDELTRYKREVVRYMQQMLGWSEEEAQRHGEDLERVMVEARGRT